MRRKEITEVFERKSKEGLPVMAKSDFYLQMGKSVKLQPDTRGETTIMFFLRQRKKRKRKGVKYHFNVRGGLG